jgi:2C-methyl-D-erythritol 2,4-cyclodiphosphate synthase
VNDSGTEPLVEIRSESGLLELRIKLTEEGPVLQMESVRMQLKATESVSIESKQVEIKATEQLALAGKDVGIEAEQNVEVDAKKDVRVRSGVDDDAEPGTHGNIYLN